MNLEETQRMRYKRLHQIMALLGKAAAGLERSRTRLFEQHVVDAGWVRSVDDIPEREVEGARCA